VCGLTFELTPTAEAGTVSLDCDDANLATGQAYSACRSGSAVERGVRRRRGARPAGCAMMCTKLTKGMHCANQHRD
jgi:hypothetical protein